MLKGQEPAQMAQTEKKAKDLGFVQQKVKEYRDKITHMEVYVYSDDSFIRTRLSPAGTSGLTSFPDYRVA